MRKLAFLLITFFAVNSFAQQTNPEVQTNPDVVWSKRTDNKNANFYQVQESFNTFWSNKQRAKGDGYKVFKRWENQMIDRVYPSGDMTLPSTNYARYTDWLRNNPSEENATRSTANWTSLYSGAVPTGYDAGAGKINFISFHPTDLNTMWIGAPDGGLWKTSNGGTSWSTNTDYLSVIGCSALVIDPATPTTMYLATGDKEFDRRSLGVWKSIDGGSTWSNTGLTWTAGDNYRITKMVMDPSNPQHMMVTTDGGIFRTTDGWETFDNLLNTGVFYDIEFQPGNSNIVYAASRNLYRSTDNGATWNLATGIPDESLVDRIELAVTAANSGYVYAIYGDTSYGFLGLYRSTDGGVSYSMRSNSPNILNSKANPGPTDTGGQSFHDLDIIVSPADEDFVTIGGINQWQSSDGGSNWNRITYWLGADPAYPGFNSEPEPYIHADIQCQYYQPGSSTTIFSGCDGGLSKSTDNGVSWADITNNINIAQQTSISLAATDDNIFFNGLQDIGSIKYTSGSQKVISGGDGEDGFIDRTNPLVIVSSTTNGAFYLSTDGGINYDDISGLPGNGEWFSPIHQDPVDAAKVYVGGYTNMYVSTDVLSGGSTWTSLGTPDGSGNVLRFAIAPSSNNTIYSLKKDAIAKSTNSGVSWTNVTGTLPVGSAVLKNICVSNTDANKVWVVFSGYSAGNKVFHSIDGGSTWTNVSTGLPNLPINTIVYKNGDTNDAVYIGADIGVYYLDNTLSAWEAFSTDLPHCAVSDLEIAYNTGKLRAATYGRGAWETDLYVATAPCAITAISAGDQTECMPANNHYSQDVTVTYIAAPGSGNLVVNGQNFAISNSPQTVTLVDLIADATAVNLTASFSAAPACTYTQAAAFTAPANCTPVCNISAISAGAQTACMPADNHYSQEVIVSYSAAPASGNLVVNGQNFAIGSSPQSVTLVDLVADAAAVNLTASFSAAPACTLSQAAAFTAPANCNPVCNISAISAGAQTDCTPADNHYSQEVIVTYSTAPASGNLVVNGQNFSIGTSPQTVTLVDLVADAAAVNVTASFSAAPACTFTQAAAFTAPANCTPVCNISAISAGAQTDCTPADNHYSQEVIVTYSTAPASGNLVVNGQNFSIGTSPQTVTLVDLIADATAVNVTASFSAAPACTLTQAAAFTAPANCTPVCNISAITAGAQTDCMPTNNTYTQEVTVTYVDAPASGTLDVNGQSFAIATSPQTVTLAGLTADGASVVLTANFSAEPSCAILVNDGFMAPAACTPVCTITGLAAGTQTACDPVTNQYSQEVIVTYSNAPTSGTLDIDGQSFPIGTSPQSVTFTELTANGAVVNGTASFSAEPTCSFSQNVLFTSPASCTPVCIISGMTTGVQTACVPATNQYTQEVIVTYSAAPGTGTLEVNGQSFAIGTSPQTVILTGLTADGGAVNVTASFSAEPACTLTQNAAFTAPASCATTPLCADIDGNGIVDINDFIDLNTAFGDACASCPEDITGDGVVDINDFIELNSQFGGSCGAIVNNIVLSTISLDLEIELSTLDQGNINPVILAKINEMSGSDQFVIRPNPSSGNYLEVQFINIKDLPANIELTVLDMNGRIISKTAMVHSSDRKSYSWQFNPELETGAYIIVAEFNSIKLAQRFIVE